MSFEVMRSRYESYSGEKNTRDHYDYCRKDPIGKLHICLVHWDELDQVSKEYNETTGENRDFKKNDSYIVENIPKFLQAAGGFGVSAQ